MSLETLYELRKLLTTFIRQNPYYQEPNPVRVIRPALRPITWTFSWISPTSSLATRRDSARRTHFIVRPFRCGPTTRRPTSTEETSSSKWTGTHLMSSFRVGLDDNFLTTSIPFPGPRKLRKCTRKPCFTTGTIQTYTTTWVEFFYYYLYLKFFEFSWISQFVWQLGVVLLEQGKPSQALAYLERALELEPDHQASLLNSAIVLQEMAANDKGHSDVNKQIFALPSLWNIHKNTLICLRRTVKRSLPRMKSMSRSLSGADERPLNVWNTCCSLTRATNELCSIWGCWLWTMATCRRLSISSK